jgi:ketosteroid isomerase-like protein
MSEENVKLARRGFAAFAKRDFEALAEIADENLEWVSALAAAEGRSYKGPEDLQRFFADLDAAWEYWRTSDPEFIPAGNDKVISIFSVRAKGRGSGVPVEQRIATTWTFRDGKAVFGVTHLDPREALRAAGLSE